MRRKDSHDPRTKWLPFVQCLSKNVGTRAELPLEIFVTDDRHDRQALLRRCRLGSRRGRGRLRLTIVVRKIAAQGDARAYKTEVVGRYDAGVDAFRHAVLSRQCYGERKDAGDALEF